MAIPLHYSLGMAKWKEVVLRNFSIFREQPQRTSPSASVNCQASPHPENVHVRLSLPDVHVAEEVPSSQSSYSLPTARRRSPTVSRARSMDARAIPRLSICTRSDSQQSTNNELRSPLSPHPRTPSPDNLSPFSEAVLRPPSPGTSGRPKSLSPLSPLLSPAFSLPSDSGVSPGAASPLGAIQPDLYKKKDMVFFQSTPGNREKSKCGRLHYKLKYDFDRSDLIIHVIEALDLGILSENGFNDPYVKVTMIPEVDNKQRQTVIRRNSTDPYFDEIFKFPVTYDELADRTLLLQLFDYDRFSRNDVTGEVSIPLADLDVTTEIEIWSDLDKRQKVSTDRPEILLSLNYLPSAGRLTVVVLKASNLVAPGSKEVPDSFVKVSLYGEKKSKKKKTSTKKHCNNPVWNEALCFDIAEEELKHGRLIINVLNCHHGNGVPAFGTCVLGVNENGTGAAHWNDMLCNPRKSIAMWHPLYL
ncbi:synaptotagmin-5-like isoform X2 [Centruroides sculpturatus]|uniref:synaptotagmin-5-like isoform X2 n=1 Tax=Centruroides sculpturatus TaxID=218467 RepID=UPI000C6E6C8C|nr:synaptotagmin-5-like isoform X2 [Centruroides sculpturatus]